MLYSFSIRDQSVSVFQISCDKILISLDYLTDSLELELLSYQ